MALTSFRTSSGGGPFVASRLRFRRGDDGSAAEAQVELLWKLIILVCLLVCVCLTSSVGRGAPRGALKLELRPEPKARPRPTSPATSSFSRSDQHENHHNFQHHHHRRHRHYHHRPSRNSLQNRHHRHTRPHDHTSRTMSGRLAALRGGCSSGGGGGLGGNGDRDSESSNKQTQMVEEQRRQRSKDPATCSPAYRRHRSLSSGEVQRGLNCESLGLGFDAHYRDGWIQIHGGGERDDKNGEHNSENQQTTTAKTGTFGGPTGSSLHRFMSRSTSRGAALALQCGEEPGSSLAPPWVRGQSESTGGSSSCRYRPFEGEGTPEIRIQQDERGRNVWKLGRAVCCELRSPNTHIFLAMVLADMLLLSPFRYPLRMQTRTEREAADDFEKCKKEHSHDPTRRFEAGPGEKLVELNCDDLLVLGDDMHAGLAFWIERHIRSVPEIVCTLLSIPLATASMAVATVTWVASAPVFVLLDLLLMLGENWLT